MKKIASAVVVLGLLCAGCGGSGAGLSAGDPAPSLSLSTGALDLHAMNGGATDSGSCTVSVYPAADWSASSSAPAWCDVSPTSGPSGTAFTVTADPATLPNGSTMATVTVSAPGLPDQTLNVTFTVHQWTLSANTVNFVVTYPSAAQQIDNVTVTTDPAQGWTSVSDQTWCTVTPSGASGTDLTVTGDPTGLAVGTYTATVTVSSAGMVDETIDVELVVQPPSGIFVDIDPAEMVFYATVGDTTTQQQSCMVSVFPSAGWTASSDQGWCTCTPSGNDGDQITVTVDPTGQAHGDHLATVTIQSGGLPDGKIDVYLVMTYPLTDMGFPGSADLYDIWGTAANDVWVVGNGGDVWRYNGSTWTQQNHGLTTENLRGVWCSPTTNDVWAVGQAATVLHYDGASWTTASLPNCDAANDLLCVWGTAPDDIWIGGGWQSPGPELWHYDGTTWTDNAFDSVGTTLGLGGSAFNDVYVTDYSKFFRYDGTSWSRVTSPFAGNEPSYYGVWASASDNVWVVGGGNPNDDATAILWDGSSWTDYSIVCTRAPTSISQILDVWGSRPGDVVGAGKWQDPSAIFHWGGLRWSTLDPGPLSSFTRVHNGVWGSGEGNVLIVGGYTEAFIYRYGP